MTQRAELSNKLIRLVSVALAVVLSLTIRAALFTPRPVNRTDDAVDRHSPRRNLAPVVEMLDTLGNEVSDAVAEYELDDDGALYELHSPQTELPRLGSPKS